VSQTHETEPRQHHNTHLQDTDGAPTIPITGVILAGGASRRMGLNKAFLELNECPVIEVVAKRLRQIADEIIIATNDVELFAPYADRAVPDVYAGVGTLGGIHAGLTAASHDLAVIVGCDMPFLNVAILRRLVRWADGYDVVLLKQELGLEPLHAVYRKSCLPEIEKIIRNGQRRVQAFFGAVDVRYVVPSEIADLDKDLVSFFNINTPDQWREINQQAAREQ
jgi:molybdopterin-guanine dinucleotide biosynthesis protein A